MSRVAITGAYGFLGWHLTCRLRALTGIEPVRLGRSDFADPAVLAEKLADADVVYHLAGVNRADSDDEVEQGNIRLADELASGLDGHRAHVVFANTIHQGSSTPYGQGKAGAAELLAARVGSLADVRLPNLFGEHGRPHYNSFVATFCHEVAHGGKPSVSNDRRIPLMHAQDAAQALMDAAARTESHTSDPIGSERLISDVLSHIEGFHARYAAAGDLPDLSDPFVTDLFNTYRSYLFPRNTPRHPSPHADDRGELFEAVRSHGGQGQAYVSTTLPGAARGEHYHLRKVERFFVVKGEAEVQLRRLLHDEVMTFRVSGSHPAIIDMPTLWVHNIRNVGQEDVVTMFWSDQLLDPERPDQFAERVEVVP